MTAWAACASRPSTRPTRTPAGAPPSRSSSASGSRVIGSMSKLTTLERLSRYNWQGTRVVQCHGVFDLLHPGHVRHLEAARKLGDRLVVTITADRYVNKGPGRPAFPEQVRAEQIGALSCVDYVAISDYPSAE